MSNRETSEKRYLNSGDSGGGAGDVVYLLFNVAHIKILWPEQCGHLHSTFGRGANV